MTHEIPFNNVKGQYNEGPQQNKPLTDEEKIKMRKKQEEILDEVLPFMRKQAEYDALKIQMYEQDVMLGKISINQLPPGLLQFELKIREIQAQSFLGQWAMGQKAAAEQAKKEMELSPEEMEARAAFDKLPVEEQMRIQEEALNKYKESKEQSDLNN